MIKRLQKTKFWDNSPPDDIESNIVVSYRNILGKKTRIHSFDDRMGIVVEGQSEELSIKDICKRERISPTTFYQWTQEFLRLGSVKPKGRINEVENDSEIERFKIVIEGKAGVTSVAQICRREGIDHETFLNWSKEFSQFKAQNFGRDDDNLNSTFHRNKILISKRSNEDVFDFFENYVDFSSDSSLVTLKTNSTKLEFIPDLKSIICLQKVNDERYINKYFEKINSKLEYGGIFIGCLETITARRKRKGFGKIAFLNNFYFLFEFLFKRIVPKVSFTKKIYFDITKGNDRLLSKAEGLGRLVSCGFNIIDFKSINGLLYFVVKKTKEPTFDLCPSYGPLYKMPRLGKNGKTIGVYKFRTMHPYSEYLQDFIVNAYGYSKTGKPANDFRIPQWGKFMRRFWLDEIPQLLNVIKGDLKLVGIRPVSHRYFQDIPKEMQKLRLTQKPGCVPPYVALNRSGNVMSVLQAEKEYLEDKTRNPYFTDIKYLINAVFNIVFKHKRSA